ncbi:MAG: DUF4255 domain-containing protein [Burkholderiales bacterium]
MIDSAISLLATRLNDAIKINSNVAHDIARASNLFEQSGNVVPDIDNTLVLFLVNVTRDTFPHSSGQGRGGGSGWLAEGRSALHLTLSIMVAANFSGRHYTDALKYLSQSINFFRLNPVFDRNNAPDIDPRIERLILDIENLPTNDLSNLWGILGGRYVPSILYKVRMITFNTNEVVGQSPTITRPATNAVAAA